MLLVLHITFVALFVGSVAALIILWRRARLAEGEAREILLGSVYMVSKNLVTKAVSGAVLVGILMLTSQPAIISGSGLFKVKVALGIILFGLTAAIHARLRRLEGDAGVSAETIMADSVIDNFLRMMVILAPIVILLGILNGHS